MPRSCGKAGCKKQPYWGVAGETPKFCFLHKSPEHIDVRNKRCEVSTCEVRPHYGYHGEAPRFCAQHKAEGMRNLRSVRCQRDGCPKYASCGPPGGPPALCSSHRGEGMVSLIGRRCCVANCDTYASYGIAGTRPRYCAKHRAEDMVNLTVKKCETYGCPMQPNFNFDGQRKARRCYKHKLEGMVDVLDRRCAQSGCDRQPIYGNSGEMSGKPTWCPDHRPDLSFDVKTARCQAPGCKKHPSYGYEHDKIRQRCRLHKLDGMVDVKSPRCEWPGCTKQPCCGHLGAKARFCSEHKEDGMVNLKTRAFRCKYRDPDHGANPSSGGGDGAASEEGDPNVHRRKSALCNRACRYAFPNEPAKFCAKHAEDGMVDVLNPQCGMEDCLELPTHGYDGEQPTFCLRHMADGMKVIEPQQANVMHWSSEARKIAEATARDASRIINDTVAGSAKATPLPPKMKSVANNREAATYDQMAAGQVPPCGSAWVTPMVVGEEPAKHDITADDVTLAFGSQEPVQISESSTRSLENSTLTANAIASAALSAAMSAAAASAAAAAAKNASAGSGVGGGYESLPPSSIPMASPPPFIASAIDVGVRAGMGLVGFMDPAGGTAVGDLMRYGRVPPLPAPLPMPSAPALVPGSGSPPLFAIPPPASNSLPFSSLVATLATTVASMASVPPLPVVTASSTTSTDVLHGREIVGGGEQESVAKEAAIAPAVPSAAAAAAALAAAEARAAAGLPQEATDSEKISSFSGVPLAASASSAPPLPPSVSEVASSGGLAGYATSNTPTVSPTVAPLPLCMASGCVVAASFGHPNLGKGATHCLVHCEDGMHRLAPDVDQSLIRVKTSVRATPVGSKRTRSAPASSIAASTEEKSAASPGAVSENAEPDRKKAKRITRPTAKVRDGMMLLAGAVAASRSHQGAKHD